MSATRVPRCWIRSRSYYEVPIATLDFASLYPSIMQAYNPLLLDAMVSPQEAATLDPSMYTKKRQRAYLCQVGHEEGYPARPSSGSSCRQRKRAKKDMKNAPTEFEKSRAEWSSAGSEDFGQLCVRLSPAPMSGSLPCLPIASSVTSYGRQLLEKTKAFVEETRTPQANGYEHDAVVVYGDTDSVMVKFGTTDGGGDVPAGNRGGRQVLRDFPQPHPSGVREGVLPLPAHEQEALRRPHVDQHRQVRLHGYEGSRNGPA